MLPESTDDIRRQCLYLSDWHSSGGCPDAMRAMGYGIKFVSRTLCDTIFQARRSSFVCDKESSRAKLNVAAPPAAFLWFTPLKGNICACTGGRTVHSLAAAEFSSQCVATSRKTAGALKDVKVSTFQPLGGCVFITTAALKERSVRPLYRKRRTKVKCKITQALRLPAEDVTKENVGEKKIVVVVESPAKARTIEKYLGGKHVVLPSFGHVRDLAAKAGSVRPDEDFKLLWEVPATARPHLNTIKTAIIGAGNLVLASDPDREGEAIAWHVLEMLKAEGALTNKLEVKRVVFNEITKAAVLRAMESPRDISVTLVEAYLARRALDYLIGFDLSPVLWRKLPGSKSAGRVQSAALRVICERETQIEKFVPQQYWTIDVNVSHDVRGKGLKLPDAENPFQRRNLIAKVSHVDGEKLSQFSLASEKEARAVAQRVENSRFSVCSVNKSKARRSPLAPYITSTLQQDASSKLAFGASRTMALAQQLYEGVKLNNDELTGLITYMRTDGTQVSGEAVQSIRSLITKRYGAEYTPSESRQFTTKVKNAQEAHEAIRPTDANRLPSMLVDIVEEDALRLYSMIWCRTIACQMEYALIDKVAADIVNDSDDLILRSTSSTVSFPGFLAVFKDNGALAPSPEDYSFAGDEFSTEGNGLRDLEAGDPLNLDNVQPRQHFTEPPARYTEGSLIKRLEELGIGRPSTYASTLKTLQSRNYVRIEKRRMFPEDRGKMVAAFLCHYFPKFSDYDFTAKMEAQLDDVSAGGIKWKSVLHGFWPDFHDQVCRVLKTPFEETLKFLEEVFVKQFAGSVERICPSCHEGTIGLKLSRFGSGYFLGCSRYKTSIFSTDGKDPGDDEEDHNTSLSSKTLGVDPATGLEIFLKRGPYGKYVQKGTVSKKVKPNRTAIPKDMNPDDIGLDQALELLKYPYELGVHPEFNLPIQVNIGQYGHFLRCKGLYVSLEEDSIASLTVDQAVALLQSKRASRTGRKGKAEDKSPKIDTGKRSVAKANKAPTGLAKTGRTKDSETTARQENEHNGISAQRKMKAIPERVAKGKRQVKSLEQSNVAGEIGNVKSRQRKLSRSKVKSG